MKRPCGETESLKDKSIVLAELLPGREKAFLPPVGVLSRFTLVRVQGSLSLPGAVGCISGRCVCGVSPAPRLHLCEACEQPSHGIAACALVCPPREQRLHGLAQDSTYYVLSDSLK